MVMMLIICCLSVLSASDNNDALGADTLTGSNSFDNSESVENNYHAISNDKSSNEYTQTINKKDVKQSSSSAKTATSIGTFGNLKDVLDEALENSTVHIDSDYVATKDDYDEGYKLVINKSLTIEGHGHTIDANYICRAFDVQANNVTIRNLTIMHGYGTGFGNGANIYWSGKDGLLENCTILSNKYDSSTYGGGLYVSGSNNLIKNCYFTNNSAYRGNAIYLAVGSFANTVSDCIFKDNYYFDTKKNRFATTRGGAIYVNGKNFVKSCYFEGNGAQKGGAIYLDGYCEITTSLFKMNKASENGLELYSNPGKYLPTVKYNTFFSTKNTSKEIFYVSDSDEFKIRIQNENWWGETYYDYLKKKNTMNPDAKDFHLLFISPYRRWFTPTYYLGYDAYIGLTSEFILEPYLSYVYKGEENTRDDFQSEFYPITFKVEIVNATTSVSSATFNINKVDIDYTPTTDTQGEIRFIYEDFVNYTIKINHHYPDSLTNLQERYLKTSGGATLYLNQDFKYYSKESYLRKGIPFYYDSIIIGNHNVIDGRNKTKIFDPKPGVNLTVINITLINQNNHTESNMTVYNYDELAHELEYAASKDIRDYTINLQEGDYNATKNIKIQAKNLKNLVINGNGRTLNGNSMFSFLDIEGNNLELTIKDLNLENFVNNTIKTTDVKLNIENTSFINNTARYGAAIYHNTRKYKEGTLNVKNSTFTQNSVQYDGGAIYTFGTQKTNINNSVFTKNSANNGGAIYSDSGFNFDSTFRLKIENSEFVENKATINGGAIFKDTEIINIKNTTFTKNTPNTHNLKGTFTDLQNALNKANTELDLSMNYVYNPKTDSNLRQGIRIAKPLTLNGNNFIIDGKNSARIFDIAMDDVRIKNVICINGKIDGKGGAIYWNGKNGVLERSNISENFARLGGALYINRNNVILNNNIFTRNYANYRGGAVFFAGYNATVTNNLFKDNQAQNGVNKAIYYNDKRQLKTFKNNTFINNTQFNWGGDANRGYNHQNQYNNKLNKNIKSSNNNYIRKIMVDNRQINIKNNKITLKTLNEIFNREFINGHLLVFIDGKLVFNGTTTDDLSQLIYNFIDLLTGNHEIRVEFTDKEGNTNSFTENIMV